MTWIPAALLVIVVTAWWLLPPPRPRAAGSRTRLDDAMPEWHYHEFHSVTVAAAPEALWRAVEDVAAQRLERAGFVRLAAEEPHEMVYALAGRFWFWPAPRVPVGKFRMDPLAFSAWMPNGAAKAAINFRIAAEPGAEYCLLSTETRIHVPDDGSARAFARYWRIIRGGSALLRRIALRVIARRAVRG